MSRLINYVSSTLVVSGLIMVILFSRLQFRGTFISKIISRFTPFVFGVYLFLLNQVIWNEYLKDAFSFVADVNIIMGVGYAVVFSALFFITGLIVEFIRSKIAKAIKIQTLSMQIKNMAEWIIIKTSQFLK